MSAATISVLILKPKPAPLFLLGTDFFILGAFAGFLNVYRVMRRIEKEKKF
jgi:hypothetical protein